jgi:spore germination cell wall hydrolase CwlJ-like protein
MFGGLASPAAFALPTVGRTAELTRLVVARVVARKQHSAMMAAVGSLLLGAYFAYGPLAQADEPPVSPIEELARLPGRPEDPVAAKIKPIAGDAARQSNASVPFASGAVLPAPSFVFGGSDQDRARAVDCLALAAMAEAGASDPGQRAVIQVVLNRVRHPAFAKSVCGVVFQGSERKTGCQFTFTCDGALARRYSEVAWSGARARAVQALAGAVFAPVGVATHYHTDWVYPYWSPSLVKLAQVETHLFFRWPGRWGSAAALANTYRGGEPALRALAMLPSHAIALAQGQPSSEAAMLASGSAEGGATLSPAVAVANGDGGGFVQVPAGATAAQMKALAQGICAGRQGCKVMGWSDAKAIPAAYPVPPQSRAKLSFSYYADPRGSEIAFFDCKLFSGVGAGECIPVARPLPRQAPVVTAGAPQEPAPA